MSACVASPVQPGRENPVQAPDGLSPEGEKVWQQIYRDYGLQLRPYEGANQDFPWWIGLGGKAYPLTERGVLDRLLRTGFFTQALQKYPIDFFRRAPIPVLFFAAKTAGGVLAGGGVSQGFSVNALNRRVAVLSLDASVYQVQDLNVALHHELFHLIDDRPYDWDWMACHEGQGPYEGVIEAPTAEAYPAPGFVSDYARTDVREDRAEVFAWMMASPDLAQGLHHYAQQDPALACKQDLIQNYVSQHFPGFNPEQFKRVRWGVDAETLQQSPVRKLRVFRASPALQTTEPYALPARPLPLPIEFLAYPRVTHFSSDLPYTSVPEAFADWEETEVFSLSAHRLQQLPEVIGSWYHLKTLVLRGQPLDELPQFLGQLPYLRQLEVDLAGDIQVDFSQFAFFQHLTLHRRSTDQWPSGLSKQTFLPALTLTGEQLETVLPLRALHNLRRLALQELPAWKTPLEECRLLIQALKKLELLRLNASEWTEDEQQQLRAIIAEAQRDIRLEFTPDVLVGDLVVE